MKLLFVVSVLCLTLANGFLFRIPTPEHPILATAAPAGVTEYFTAFFAHFDLDQPNQILNCFDDKNAVLFWKELDLTSDLAQNIEERNHVKVHLGWGELVLLEKALESLHGCMAATQDFSDLLHALGAEERNPKLFMIAQYVYFQANYGKLSQELPKVVEAIKNKDWKGAGELKASIVQSMADELKDKGLALEALDALWNGVHIELGLGDAQSVFGCWNKETAHVRLEFIWGMAKAVVDGKWIDAATSVEKWYQEKGNALLGKIPESTWQCWGKSVDTKVESEKLKIDLSSHEFHEKVNNFVHRHPAAFWHMQKNIHDALKEHNMMHAGAEYGHVMKAAVNSKW